MKYGTEDRITFVAGAIESLYYHLVLRGQDEQLDEFDELIERRNRRGWETDFNPITLSDDELSTAQARAWLAIYQ